MFSIPSLRWPLAAFLVSLIAGGLAGRSMHRPAPAGNRMVVTQSTPSANPNRSITETRDDRFARILAAVDEKESVVRAHLLYSAIGELRSADLSELFQKALTINLPEKQHLLLVAVLKRWLSIDPAGASAAVQPFCQKVRAGALKMKSLEYAVYEAWAVVAPQQTLAEIMQAPDAPRARALAHSAIGALSDGDLKVQLQFLAAQPSSKLRSEMCRRAIEGLAEKNYDVAVASLELLPDRRMRMETHASILQDLAKRDPAAGLAQLAKLAPTLPPGVDGIRLVAAALGKSALSDVPGSLAAIESLPERLQNPALGALLVGWAERDAVAALQWGLEHEVDFDDAKGGLHFGSHGMSWRGIFSVAFDQQSAPVLDWIMSQAPSASRDSMLCAGISSAPMEKKLEIFTGLTPAGQAGVAGSLVRSSLRYGGNGNLDVIEPWIREQPAGAGREAAVRELVSYQAKTTPDRLGELLDQWSTGADRDAALGGVAAYLTETNTAKATEYARQITDPTLRETAFDRIASQLGYQDKPTARRWIETTPGLSADQRRILLRTLSER